MIQITHTTTIDKLILTRECGTNGALSLPIFALAHSINVGPLQLCIIMVLLPVQTTHIGPLLCRKMLKQPSSMDSIRQADSTNTEKLWRWCICQSCIDGQCFL